MGVHKLAMNQLDIMHFWVVLLLICLAISSPVEVVSSPNFIYKDSENIPLVTFDGAEGTTFKFHVLNDPVMGGVFTGTFEVDEENATGIFNGTVKIVPSLQAPGFLSFEADGQFADASSAISGGILIRLRTSTPDYNCRFGGSIPLTGGCFKSLFHVPPSVDNEFVDVKVPFSSFSDHWSPETGEHTIECSDDPKVCPTAEKLEHIKTISIMAEGVAGDVHLEVLSISATSA